MLKHVYRRLIAFHPSYFRSRFGDEMLSIFDQAETSSARLRLIGDAVISVLRQWGLRPQFWEEPVLPNAVPASAAPEFLVFENFRPRTGALIDGALLSALIFTIVCFAMGYAWNHPVRVRIVQPYWRISRGAASSQTPVNRAAPPTPVPTPSPLYTDEGRVVLVFPSSRVNTRADAGVLPTASITSQTVASYVGTYRSDSGQKIIVRLTPTEFSIQEAGLQPVGLTPISETQFVGRSLRGYAVSFRAGERGVFDSLEILRNGIHITARRE
jgi:hypothetical protein